MASIRYIVQSVDEAIEFYERLGFEVRMHPAPGFAMLQRGDLRLMLNAPGGGGGAGQLPDGTLPSPGGWNRFQLEVDDVAASYAELSRAGVRFRSEPIEGVGGIQVLADDPSGNPVELFQSLPR